MDTTLNNSASSEDYACRCCCKTFSEDQLQSLFEYTNDEMELYKIVMLLVPISICRNDGYSQKICLSCKNQAMSAYQFRQMCVSTDENARSNRKPLVANNEHDYSTWNINDTFDMDLSEYLIDETKEETIQHQLLPEPEIYQTPAVDETQNFDAPVPSKRARRYSCPVCSKLWVTPSKLKRHMSVHRNEKSVKEIAKTVTGFSKILFNEQPKQTLEAMPEVQCPICFLAIESQSKLYQHMTAFHMKTESRNEQREQIPVPTAQKIGKSYICSLCQNVSLTPAKLQAHMKAKHAWKNLSDVSLTNEKWTKHFCSFCSRSFPNPQSLKRHVTSHQKPKKTVRKPRPRKYSCQHCGKRFETPSKIQRHLTVHRDILQTSKCEADPILEISAVTSILGD